METECEPLEVMYVNNLERAFNSLKWKANLSKF
jgi:hypothetical protein